MKVIRQDIHEGDEDGEGSIVIALNGYIYNLGQMDNDCFWIERQLIEDYYNDLDGYEHPEWSSAKDRHIDFKFLKRQYENLEIRTR